MDSKTLAVCLGSDPSKAANWLDDIQSAMQSYGITTPERQAAFLAQAGHETGGLKWIEELWGPTDAQKRYEPPSDLATKLGNTHPGDGKKYRGRGLIQVTGRANYDAVGRALCLDCTNNPDMLVLPEWASGSAAWWWQQHGLNELADAGNFEKITRVINGGLNGYDDRLRRWDIAKQALGGEP